MSIYIINSNKLKFVFQADTNDAKKNLHPINGNLQNGTRMDGEFKQNKECNNLYYFC